ncbi:MAG: hypothetical protein AB1297_03710 [bacterium]
MAISLKHKHYLLDQTKITRVKTILNTPTETEAIDRALSLVLYQNKMYNALKNAEAKGTIKKLYD